MYQKIFPGIIGWRRLLALMLFLIANFGMVNFSVAEIESFMLPSRFEHGSAVWVLLVVSFIATVAIALVVKSIKFLPLLMTSVAGFIFLLLSYSLFDGRAYLDHRIVAAFVGVIFFAFYFLFFKWGFRLIERNSLIAAETSE